SPGRPAVEGRLCYPSAKGCIREVRPAGQPRRRSVAGCYSELMPLKSACYLVSPIVCRSVPLTASKAREPSPTGGPIGRIQTRWYRPSLAEQETCCGAGVRSWGHRCPVTFGVGGKSRDYRQAAVGCARGAAAYDFADCLDPTAEPCAVGQEGV